MARLSLFYVLSVPKLWHNRPLSMAVFTTDLVKLYNRLMNRRAIADYSSEVSFGKEEVSGLMEQVKLFNEAVIQLIEQESKGQ